MMKSVARSIAGMLVIFLNSGSDRAMYPIPREFFDRMK